MANLPKIDAANRLKPLSYDPQTERFMTYDEIVNRQAKIVPVEELSHDQLVRLIVERQRVGPDYKMADLNGRMLTRDQVVEEIVNGTEFGTMMVEAEASYLADFIEQIRAALAR